MSSWGSIKKRKGGGGQSWQENREKKKKEQSGLPWLATYDKRKGYEGPHPGSYAAAELAALDDAAEETAANSGPKRKVAVLLVRCSMRRPVSLKPKPDLAVHSSNKNIFGLFCDLKGLLWCRIPRHADEPRSEVVGSRVGEGVLSGRRHQQEQLWEPSKGGAHIILSHSSP
jgi:hypothetical protein